MMMLGVKSGFAWYSSCFGGALLDIVTKWACECNVFSGNLQIIPVLRFTFLCFISIQLHKSNSWIRYSVRRYDARPCAIYGHTIVTYILAGNEARPHKSAADACVSSLNQLHIVPRIEYFLGKLTVELVEIVRAHPLVYILLGQEIAPGKSQL